MRSRFISSTSSSEPLEARTQHDEPRSVRLGPHALAVAAVGLVVIVASAPAWTGGPVYDDWLMRESPYMGTLRDAALAFVRTSADYFRDTEYSPVTGATYRPLSLASLIVVQALGGAPLAHHALSLALHLGAFGALYAALLGQVAPRTALLLAGVWALHPMQVESYGWINGRSDVLAGACVAALALALARRPRAWWMLAVCTTGAVLAKETALFAVGALGLAAALPRRGVAARTMGPLLAVGSGVAVAVGLRAALVGLAQAGAGALRVEPSLPHKVARLYAEAIESMLVPVPRTMASLAWELSMPMQTPLFLLLCASVAALVYLAVRGYARGVVLLLGAIATLLPTVVVSSAFWCGFDRYLYMPSILLVLALAELGPRARPTAPRPAYAMLATVFALGLALSTHATSTHYRSQAAFMASLIQMRPEDPSGSLFGARWLGAVGKRAEALALLASVPREGLPRPLASALVTRLAGLGERDAAIAVLEDMVRRYPDDPYAIYDLTWTSIQRGDLARAFAAAERLRAQPGFCEGVRGRLEVALHRPGVDHARIASFRAQYACR